MTDFYVTYKLKHITKVRGFPIDYEIQTLLYKFSEVSKDVADSVVLVPGFYWEEVLVRT